MECIAYIVHLEDLIKIQLQNGFKKSPICFSYESVLLPIPTIPFLNNKAFDNNFYYTQISRSQMLCVFVTKFLNKTENDKIYNCIDYKELIAISDKHFEDSDHSKFVENNADLMEYKYLVYPCSIVDPDSRENNYGFFLELPDYNRYINGEEDRFLNNNFFDDDEEEIIYPEGWDDLDPGEKYAYDFDLAESESRDPYEQDDMDYFYYNDSEPNDEYFYSEKDYLLKIASNISCISLSDHYATFEIIREDYYQNIVCPIVKNPFVKGLLIFSGIIPLGLLDQIQFVITEKCKKKILKKVLLEVMNFKEYRVVSSNNFFICFNLEFRKNFKDSNIADELNPTRIFVVPF